MKHEERTWKQVRNWSRKSVKSASISYRPSDPARQFGGLNGDGSLHTGGSWGRFRALLAEVQNGLDEAHLHPGRFEVTKISLKVIRKGRRMRVDLTTMPNVRCDFDNLTVGISDKDIIEEGETALPAIA